MAKPMTPVTVTADRLHPSVEVLVGWCLRGNETAINLRAGAVDGPLLAALYCGDKTTAEMHIGERTMSAPGGVYVEIVEGDEFDEGVIYRG